MTNDYKRHGTTTLFAALNVLDGTVISACMQKHRQDEFLKFLKKIDQETLQDLDLHLIVDNYGAHKTAQVQTWLKSNPRFTMHFTPTSSSWLNMVERFFSELTTKRVWRGVFRSVKELEKTIRDLVEKHNEKPKIFTWTKDADTILAKVAKCKEPLGIGHWMSWDKYDMLECRSCSFRSLGIQQENAALCRQNEETWSSDTQP